MKCAECGSYDMIYVNSGICKCKICGSYSPEESANEEENDFFETAFEKIRHKDPKELWDE